MSTPEARRARAAARSRERYGTKRGDLWQTCPRCGERHVTTGGPEQPCTRCLGIAPAEAS